MIWLFVAHVLAWFFIWFFIKFALLFAKVETRKGMFFQATVMGSFSFFLHIALSKVAGVPLIIQ